MPLHSRCTVIDFAMTLNDKQILAGTFLQRLCDICDAENIQYEKVLVELIMKFFLLISEDV